MTMRRCSIYDCVVYTVCTEMGGEDTAADGNSKQLSNVSHHHTRRDNQFIKVINLRSL